MNTILPPEVEPSDTESTRPSSIRQSCRSTSPLNEVAWTSDDSSTSVWRLGRSQWALQTTDPDRGQRLREIEGVMPFARVDFGGYREVFCASLEQLRASTTRRVLRGAA